VEGFDESGLEVAQQGVEPPELRQVVGMLAVGDDSLVVAVGCGYGPEAGQAIGKEMAAWREVSFGPIREYF
jgi:pantoate kinase